MKKVLFVVAMLLMLLALSACGGGTQAPADQGTSATDVTQASDSYRDTINIAMDVDPETFVPLLWKNTTAYRLGHLIYKGLVYIDSSLTPQPALAESWENPDEMTWVFSSAQGRDLP